MNKLEMQLQPDSSSCMPTALAMCLGVPVLEVIDAIGHDGRQVFWPSEQGARKFRGFHLHELICCCLKYGFTPVYFEVCPMFQGPDGEMIEVYYNPDFIRNHFLNNPCVLMGKVDEKQHAVAWCHVRRKCLDPEGVMYDLDNFEMWYILRC